MKTFYELKQAINEISEKKFSDSMLISVDGKYIDNISIRESPYIAGRYIFEINTKKE